MSAPSELHDAWMAAMRHGEFSVAHAISDEVRRTVAPPPPGDTPRHLQRVWTGEPVADRHVLVRCHHGLGDTIQFARFLPPLARCARTVAVCAQETLLPLLRTLPLHDAHVAWHAMTDEEPVVTRNVDIEIMELLQLFRSTLDTLPRAVPYLHVPDSGRRGPLPTVGVVWSAGDWAPQRSMAFEQIAPLLEVPGIEWCSLQHAAPGVTAHMNNAAGVLPVHGARPVWRTACEMRGLDLVITVDSMPAHLAGALGIPVWTLLPHDADWRWMIGRSDSPWYPSMRLFRQPTPGDWRSVVHAVRGALEGWQRRPRL